MLGAASAVDPGPRNTERPSAKTSIVASFVSTTKWRPDDPVRATRIASLPKMIKIGRFCVDGGEVSRKWGAPMKVSKRLVAIVGVGVVLVGAAEVAAVASQRAAEGATATHDGGCGEILADGTMPTGPQLRAWVVAGYPSVIYHDPVEHAYLNVFTVPASAPGGKAARLKPSPMLVRSTRDSSAEGAAACYLPPASNASFYAP